MSEKETLTALIVTIIDENGSQTVYEIGDEVEMPLDLLTEYLFELTERNILKYIPEEHSFALGDAAADYIIDDKEELGVEAVFEQLQPYPECSGYPHFNSFEELNAYLKLDHINPNAYHKFYIFGKKKRPAGKFINKKFRCITAPSLELKKRQRWILDNILSHYVPTDCVHGFVKGKSIVTNAQCHIGKRETACIDIKDFFPSITDSQIMNIYTNMGYSESISKILTVLTTFKNRLPQGAPTSPTLSNIVMEPLDSEILEYAVKNGLVYTRYADDITISGDQNIEKHKDEVIKIVERYNFIVNRDKTHLWNSSSGRKVTGLSVDSSVKVPLRYKRKLRQEIYYCKKHGISYHLKNSNNRNEKYVNYVGYLYGKAYFIKMVEPQVGNGYIKQLDELFN